MITTFVGMVAFLLISGWMLGEVGTAPAFKEMLDRECESQYATCLLTHHVDCTHGEILNGSACTTSELVNTTPWHSGSQHIEYVQVTRPFNMTDFNATCKCVINMV